MSVCVAIVENVESVPAADADMIVRFDEQVKPSVVRPRRGAAIRAELRTGRAVECSMSAERRRRAAIANEGELKLLVDEMNSGQYHCKNAQL